jgi:hypothetical protein
MAYLLAGAAVVIFVLWLAGSYVRANPAQLAPLVRKTIGGACILLSGFLTLRGALPVAVPVFFIGFMLLGLGNPLAGLGFPGSRTPGQTSSVRTSVLAMELDHDTGDMDGEVLSGPYEGRRLSQLNLEDLIDLLDLCRSANDRSEALLEAYLDKAHSGWRERHEREAGAEAGPPPSSGPMTVEEALAILGVTPEASAEEIRAAHRRLMKQYHPDSGGSDYLAAKVNQAKDLLLKRSGKA